jgi:hypothetical protein
MGVPACGVTVTMYGEDHIGENVRLIRSPTDSVADPLSDSLTDSLTDC